MSVIDAPSPVIQAAVDSLVSVQHWADASFIRLPLVYPSGSLVTVKVDPLAQGRFRISDAGFGYRELEDVGAERSFSRTAATVAEASGLAKATHSIFIETNSDQLVRAISDVAAASWQIVDRIYSKIREDGEDEIVSQVIEKLHKIFGEDQVKAETTLIGASTSEWEMTASVRQSGRLIVFQAVGAHANSIYRANAAFDDLAALDDAPALVAVVRDKTALGAKLSLLARSANVIEEEQPESVYLKAAA